MKQDDKNQITNEESATPSERKLSLKKKVIRELDLDELASVAGGATENRSNQGRTNRG